VAGVSNLAAGTWEDAEAMVGQTIATLEGADAVSVGDIRRKLEVLGFDCPLHTDDAVARAYGYRGLVSPCSMARVWAMPSYWKPGRPLPGNEQLSTPTPATMIPGEGDTLIATRVRMEYLAPVYIGDRLTARAVLRSVTRKTTRVGPGAFLVVDTTYTNQDTEVVAIESVTLLRYSQRGSNVSPGADGSGGPAPAARALVGVGLPAFAVTLTLQRVVMEAAANRDFAPIHYDPEAASGSGAPNVYVNGTFVETLLEVMIRSWAGLGARIRVIEFSMLSFNCVGDEIEASGVVSKVNETADPPTAELEVWIDGPRGRTVTGSAIVELTPVS
jgi:3-methylfumaryl-CoA hydratase